MSAVNKNISRILLVGDLRQAFLDADTISDMRSETCADMPQALDIAARKNFDAIAIVMSGISAKLSSNLKVLRDNCDAKAWPMIILSARSGPIAFTKPL